MSENDNLHENEEEATQKAKNEALHRIKEIERSTSQEDKDEMLSTYKEYREHGELITDRISEDNVTYSDRGFKFVEEVKDSYGSSVRVSESSSAFTSHIWLRAEGSEVLHKGSNKSTKDNEVALHLKIEDAKQLRDNLDYLINNHYHIELYGGVVDENDAGDDHDEDCEYDCCDE